MTDALLLMDIQNAIFGQFGAGDDYLDRVVAAQATAEAANRHAVGEGGWPLH